MKKGCLTLIALLAAFALINCGGGTSSSQEIQSRELSAVISVDASGDGTTTVTARFSTLDDVIDGIIPITSTVRLEGDDILSVTAYGDSQEFTRATEEHDIAYVSEFDSDMGPENFVVSLNRYNGSEVLNSRVTLPAKLDIMTPTEDEIFMINDIIELSWDPITDDEMILCIRTACYEETNEESSACAGIQEEEGRYVFHMSDHFEEEAHTLVSEDSCTAIIDLQRSSTGVLARDFSAGYIQAYQQRSRTVVFDLM